MTQPETNAMQNRFFTFERSSVSETDRTVQLSCSSEAKVERWYGSEILDHTFGAPNLVRLNDMGVLLFNHDSNVVLGGVLRAWQDETTRRVMAVVRFDTDAESEKIWQKVLSGTLKGVSISYSVEVYETVAEGVMSSDGRFAGPCYIAKRWTIYEVSIVSVPADPSVGVDRGLDQTMRPLIEAIVNERLAVAKVPDPPAAQASDPPAQRVSDPELETQRHWIDSITV